MHKYEVMFIVRPDVAEDEVEKVVSQMEGYVTAAGGKIEKIEKIGRRKLAYRVHRHREGFFVRFAFESEPPAVSELERRMRVTDTVIKFLTVRVDEEQKRAAKRAEVRAKKEAKRPKAAPPAQPPLPPPAEPSPA